MTTNVLLYTAPGCPDCDAVKRWLGDRRIAFRERDISQPAVSDEAKIRYGIRVAPITVIDGEAFYGTFAFQRGKLAGKLGV